MPLCPSGHGAGLPFLPGTAGRVVAVSGVSLGRRVVPVRRAGSRRLSHRHGPTLRRTRPPIRSAAEPPRGGLCRSFARLHPHRRRNGLFLHPLHQKAASTTRGSPSVGNRERGAPLGGKGISVHDRAPGDLGACITDGMTMVVTISRWALFKNRPSSISSPGESDQRSAISTGPVTGPAPNPARNPRACRVSRRPRPASRRRSPARCRGCAAPPSSPTAPRPSPGA